MKVLVASQSPVKLAAVQQRWPQAQGLASSAATPAQPINSALHCAHLRLDAIQSEPADLYLAIENGIDTIGHLDNGGDARHYVDVCCVVAQLSNERREAISFGIPINKRLVETACAETPPDYALRNLGCAVTAGALLAREFGVTPDNWMADARFGGVDRKAQILDALNKL